MRDRWTSRKPLISGTVGASQGGFPLPRTANAPEGALVWVT